MSDIIKIHNLPGLAQYGQSLIDYGNTVESATKETEREFVTKTDDSVSDAVLAFFLKLNTLQTQVFHQAPEVIRKYGNNVQFFEDTVTGAGFNVLAWTSEEGKNTVVKKLTGEQIDEMKGVMDRLQPLLDSAAEKTSFPEVNLTSQHLETARSTLESLAAERTATHVGIEAAHNLFGTNLSDTIANLDALVAVINHTKASMLISPSAVFQAIGDGVLTAENMYLLDSVENETDSQALQAVLEKKPEKLMKLDDNKISQATYGSISGVMEVWIDKQDAATLNRLMSAMSEEDMEKVQRFAHNIKIAEDARGESLKALMYAHFMEYETRTDDYMLDSYHNLDLMNRLTGLMSSVQVLEVGRHKEKSQMPGVKNNHDHFYTYYKNNLSISFEVGQQKLVRTTYSFVDYDGNLKNSEVDDRIKLIDSLTENQPGLEKRVISYYSRSEDSTFGVNSGKYSENMVKLEKEREEARKQFVKDLSISTIDSIALVAGPQWALGNKLMQSVMRLDVAGAYANGTTLYKRYHPNTAPLPEGKWDKAKAYTGKTLNSSFSSYMKDYLKWADKEMSITMKEDVAKNERIQEYLSQGELQLETANGTMKFRDSTHYHDFNASLRLKEMDNNGITGFMIEDKIARVSNIEEARQEIDKKITEINSIKVSDLEPGEKKIVVSREVQDYLRGQGDLSLKEMTSDQLEQMETVVRRLGGNSSTALDGYLDKKYGE